MKQNFECSDPDDGTGVDCAELHFGFGWHAAVDEAEAQGQSAEMGEYLVQWARDTFENLQSEFWQLAVQFALLAGLFRWIGIHAYEEDLEDVKRELAEIKAALTSHVGKPGDS